MPTDPRREKPSTYVVQNRSNREELTRLQIQDQLLTTGMGGVLQEQPDPLPFERILDVGCGTGGWLIETAKTYPSLSQLVGVDISGKMIEYARSQALAQGVGDRVEFRVMDALGRLEFSNHSFDLVNLRFGTSYLRTWDWSPLLSEFERITRPGGVIRITEADMIESTSPALTCLLTMMGDALQHAGHLFTPPGERGVSNDLVRLLARQGVCNIQTYVHTLVYRSGTPEGNAFFEDNKRVYRTVQPFIQKWSSLPDDYETIYEQMLDEMQRPDFLATWPVNTIWGATSL
jgi:ubiquinone/menaquinone biosynthesis C-methylase UbiE